MLSSSLAHSHVPEVSLEVVSLLLGLPKSRGRICLHSTSPIPCFGGIGYVVVVVIGCNWEKISSGLQRGGLQTGEEGTSSSPPVECNDVKVILPKKSQTILDAPLGYVGLYTHHFSLSNLRLPIPPFISLKTTWKHSPKRSVIYHRGQEMDFRSFMLERVDGELNFLPAEGVSEGQNSPYAKIVNNDAPVIGATPLSSVYPSNIVKNVVDSDDPSYAEDEQTLVGPSLPPHPEANKKLKILGKKKVASSIPGKALPSKAVLDNVLNSRTRELIFALHKAKTSYDAIRARELDKDGLMLKSKKATRCGLNKDRAGFVSKLISDAAMKLVRSDDLEVAAMKEPFVLEKMLSYRPSSKEEYDQAGDVLANASYHFLAEYVVNPYASLE
ncbi:hypothetical protein Tco_0194014 [Tanacetum coccineum]